jgi:asparaginyl-tRNA synthetase
MWLILTIFPTEAPQPRIGYQSEHERYLTEKYAKKPVIVMNYPKAIKAF